MYKIKYLILFNLILWETSLQSQILSTEKDCENYHINRIEIDGNEKTKRKIILIELGIRENETIPKNQFQERIQRAESNLRRTGLFSEVSIEHVLDLDTICKAELKVELVENWLLFPTLIVETIDRNFNVWWDEFNHDINRINFGIGITHNNLTGIRDRLKIKVTRGFSDKYELQYSHSYIGKSNRINMFSGIIYNENREAPYRIEDGFLKFFSSGGENVQFKKAANLGLEYQETREKKWLINAAIDQIKVNSRIPELNPDYLLDASSSQRRMVFIMSRSFNSLNHFVIPTSGCYSDITTKLIWIKSKDLHQFWELSLRLAKAQKLFNRFRYQGSMIGQVSFIREKFPLNFYSGVGVEENILNGYEYYFIPGMDYINTRHSLFFKLLEFRRDIIKLLRTEPKLKVHVITEALLRAGIAYVNDPFYKEENILANQLLRSVSAGLQFGINGILKLEMNYSVNHLGERGFFFQTIRLF